MLIGMVEGSVVSTIKHRSMQGWRLLVVQAVDFDGRPDGDPLLAIDALGAGVGTRVVVSNDGKGAREMVGDTNSPVRWAVIGVVDD